MESLGPTISEFLGGMNRHVVRIEWGIPNALSTYGKSPGVKRSTPVTVYFDDGTHRSFVLKSIDTDEHRLGENESFLSILRLATANPTATPIWRFSRGLVQSTEAVGIPTVYLLEERHSERLLADILVSAPTADLARDGTALGNTLGEYLRDRHKPRPDSAHQYLRELIGGSYGLLSTIDTYDPPWRDILSRRDLLSHCGRWYDALLARPVVAIHGDFHPWNVFCDVQRGVVRTTGGLHTSFGLAEDDLGCLGVNLAVLAATSDAHRSAALTACLSSLAKTYPVRSTCFSFFFGWRLLVIASPLHYPHWPAEVRQRLLRAAMYALAGRAKATDLVALADELFGRQDPWIRLECHTVSRPRATESVSIPRSSTTVSGRVQDVRRSKAYVFVDLLVDGDLISAALPRDDLVASGCVDTPRKLDLLACTGQFSQSRSGRSTFMVDRVLHHTPCRLDLAVQTLNLPHAKLLLQATVLAALRNGLASHGFRELISPVLTPSHIGGLSRPFLTRRVWDDSEQCLRASAELPLKRAVAAGIPRLYELGPMFRNEAEDRRHLPEFIMLEAYAAFTTMNDLVTLLLDVFRQCLPQAGASVFRVDALQAIRSQLGLDVTVPSALTQLSKMLHRPPPADDFETSGMIHAAIRQLIAPTITGLSVFTSLPAGRSPLIAQSGPCLDRAFVFAQGVSIADVFQCNVDYYAVHDRLAGQLVRDRYFVSRDYSDVLALYGAGLPPHSAAGVSVSRMLQVAAGSTDIRTTKTLEVGIS